MGVGSLTASPTEILHRPGDIEYMIDHHLRKLHGAIKPFGQRPDEIFGLS